IEPNNDFIFIAIEKFKEKMILPYGAILVTYITYVSATHGSITHQNINNNQNLQQLENIFKEEPSHNNTFEEVTLSDTGIHNMQVDLDSILGNVDPDFILDNFSISGELMDLSHSNVLNVLNETCNN